MMSPEDVRPSADEEVKMEALIDQLKPLGRFQVTSFIIFNTGMMFCYCFSLLIFVFIGLSPEHHCTVPTSDYNNPSVQQPVVITGSSSCVLYTSDNESTGCVYGWTYNDTEELGRTIVTEWDLVCEHSYLVELSQTIMIFGQGIGFCLIGPQPDRFGRKPVQFASIAALSLATIVTAFSNSYTMFVMMRFIQGIFLSGCATGFTISMEIFPTRYRGYIGILCQPAWMAAMLLLDLIAYFVRDWQIFCVVLGSLPLLLLPFYFYVSETIPWLVARGRLDEAQAIVDRVAKINGLSSVPDVLAMKTHVQVLQSLAQQDQKPDVPKPDLPKPDVPLHNIWTMFTNNTMRKHCIVMIVVWFNCTFVYYGISYTSTTWYGNRFVNFLLNGLAELPPIVLCLLMLKRFERNTLIRWCLIGAGIVLLVSALIPDKDGSLVGLVIALIMAGKILACTAFNIALLYTPELFPTTLRSTGSAITTIGSLSGSLASSFCTYLARFYPAAPVLLFAFLSMLTGPVLALLPSTKDRPLAQTLEEMEAWREKPNCCKRICAKKIGQRRNVPS